MVSAPCVTVLPDPDSSAPASVVEPVTVTVPEPVSVLPMRSSAPSVAGPAKEIVPLFTVVVPVTAKVEVAPTANDPPFTCTLPAPMIEPVVGTRID